MYVRSIFVLTLYFCPSISIYYCQYSIKTKQGRTAWANKGSWYSESEETSQRFFVSHSMSTRSASTHTTLMKAETSTHYCSPTNTQASHMALQQLPAVYVYTKTCDVHVWPCAHCSGLEFQEVRLPTHAAEALHWQSVWSAEYAHPLKPPKWSTHSTNGRQLYVHACLWSY